MIRRYGSALRAMLMAADAVLAVVTALVVYQVRWLLFPGSPDPQAFSPAWASLALYAGIWVLILYLEGQYRLRAQWTVRSEVAGVLRSVALLALVSVVLLFVLNLSTGSRLFLLLLFPVQAAVTIATRIALRGTFQVLRSRGTNMRNVLIVGTGEQAVAYANLISGHAYLGLRVIGLIGTERPMADSTWPYLGGFEALGTALHEGVVDEVAICLPASQLGDSHTISRICQEEGKIVRIPLDIPHLGHGRTRLEDLDGTAILSITTGPDQLAGLAIKRLLDITGAGVSLIVLSPLLLLVALYILVKDGRPVIFAQTRVGIHGRLFRLYKFRTMVRDAEQRYGEVESLNHMQGAGFKVKDDPRITPWGLALRRTSIDELPQLWNVLRGEMSLVGPRPAVPREVQAYDLWHRRRLSMKPGLTGLWQISSRLDEHFDDRAALDLDYIDRWSLWLDIRIVLQTLPAMFRQPGH